MKVIQVFNLIKKYHPFYNDIKLSKQNLFKELFPSLKYKESYIRNLFSDLNIMAEKFLQQINSSKNYADEKFLIEELNNRDMTELMDKKVRAFEKKIVAGKFRDQNYYLNRIFIFDMKSYLKSDKTLTEENLSDEIQNKINLFLTSVMETHFQMIIEEQRVRINHDFGFLKHILKYMGNNPAEFKDSSLLLVFYNLWMCFFDKDDEKYFRKVKKLFKTHYDSLTIIDKKNIYAVLQTYCMNKIAQGHSSYNGELLNILFEMLKFNVVSHKKDLIHLNLYRNVLLLCFSLKKTKILKNFISDYIGFVRLESRASISAYSYAFLNFLLGNFEKSLELCNEVNFSNLFITTGENLYFKNDVRKLVLQCLYELNYFENAITHIDAHKHFLNNSKLIKETMRKRNMNFLNLVSELIKLRLRFEDVKFTEFKSKALNTVSVERDWLLSKISELENID